VKAKSLGWGFVEGKPLDITTEQMLSLIQLFPRDALMVKTTARPTQNRKHVPGSMDAVLVDAFLVRVAEMKLDKNEAIDQAFTEWLKSKR
jgi:hypothetical protein